ncbi:hypothetical protein AQUCO_00200394v1 [Aquilegia coerulea]|uniref:NOL9 C-terminal domain-containing protein n=1 Tax=Aquilegia coerulea TaxID=218851 RepID=A0A2G5F308_AQUCA|nr:hypothetical protein AQUCO_00200394v1 [Aquilegia coerulea]
MLCVYTCHQLHVICSSAAHIFTNMYFENNLRHKNILFFLNMGVVIKESHEYIFFFLVFSSLQGIGRDMLEKMVRYFSPTHVVQIRITAEKKNLPSGAFWLPEGQEYEGPDLIEIKTAFEDSFKRSVLILKDARLMRDIRIIAYFRQCLASDLDISSRKELAHALASHPPYEVPLSSIKVTHLYCQVPSSESFHALNASIVGLAVTSAKSTNSEACTPWCVGLGIVRGIDVSKDLLYVLTPVPQRVLVKVDLLLQGFLQIPTSLLQVQGYRSPYMSANVL